MGGFKYEGVLYQAAGPYIFALAPLSGYINSKHQASGRSGILNPVIVGGTMYLGNSLNWVMAISLLKIMGAH